MLGDTDRLLINSSLINDASLQLIALLPTAHLDKVVDDDYLRQLSDRDFMRIAVFLAKKGYDEGGCAIGALIIDNESRCIVGKGHNRHIQENRVYWHGETDAMNDAGPRVDFSRTTLFTTLTPCEVCTSLAIAQGFKRIVIGNTLDGVNQENEDRMRSKGVTVDIVKDAEGIELYQAYSLEKPEQDVRDWQGQAGVVRAKLDSTCL